MFQFPYNTAGVKSEELSHGESDLFTDKVYVTAEDHME